MKKELLLTAVAIISATSVYCQRYLTPQFSNVTITSDVVYGQNYGYNTTFTSLEDLKMDVYEPEGDTLSQRPVIILGHAGSFLNLYQWGNKEQYSVVELCKRFAKLGYVAVSIDYRLGWAAGSNDAEEREKTIINAVYRAMQDFKTCVRYFKKDALNANQWKIDPCKVFVGGTNSGGYSALAVGTLNKQSELVGFKFLDSQGNPYIDQSKTGSFDGFGGTQNVNNHAGYTSDARAILALGAATGDSTWIEAGEIPVVALAGVDETSTPYNTAIVITTSGTPIIVVSGSGDFMPRHERLGNNAVFAAASLPQGPPNKNGAGQITQPVEGLYPFHHAGFEPWSWYDGNQPVGDPSLNPNASQVRGMAYIDTIISYTAPRFYQIIQDPTACQVTDSTTGISNVNKEDVSFSAVPNPSSSTITIISSSPETAIVSAALFDINGRMVRSVENQSGYYAVLPVEDLTNGMYVIQIQTKDGNLSTKKVIVQH